MQPLGNRHQCLVDDRSIAEIGHQARQFRHLPMERLRAKASDAGIDLFEQCQRFGIAVLRQLALGGHHEAFLQLFGQFPSVDMVRLQSQEAFDAGGQFGQPFCANHPVQVIDASGNMLAPRGDLGLKLLDLGRSERLGNVFQEPNDAVVVKGVETLPGVVVGVLNGGSPLVALGRNLPDEMGGAKAPARPSADACSS